MCVLVVRRKGNGVASARLLDALTRFKLRDAMGFGEGRTWRPFGLRHQQHRQQQTFPTLVTCDNKKEWKVIIDSSLAYLPKT